MDTEELTDATNPKMWFPTPHSIYLIHTAEKIASLRNITLEEVARQTTSNARRLFKLPKVDGGEMTAGRNE